jgi:hypothetical protein
MTLCDASQSKEVLWLILAQTDPLHEHGLDVEMNPQLEMRAPALMMCGEVLSASLAKPSASLQDAMKVARSSAGITPLMASNVPLQRSEHVQQPERPHPSIAQHDF